MRKLIVYFFDTALTAIFVVGIGYNLLVGLNSQEGVRMTNVLRDQIEVETVRLESLRADYEFLNQRADRLLSRSLDQDLLEERVRSVLGLVQHGEYLVRVDDLDRVADLGAPAANDDVPAPADVVPDNGVRYAAFGLVSE